MVEAVSEKPTVAIIGAGFSGICAFIQVQKRLGIKPQIFELSDDVGGTWKQNVYPGCGCDVPSHVYSLSSDLNPDWSNTYSPQAEIYEYLRNVSKKHQIYENTQFQTEVVKATWVNDRYQWKLDIRKKNETNITTLYFDILFSGVGSLRVPHVPSQFKNFQGQIVHTAAWDWSIDFKDKRIAVIGSGSSACQAIPFLTENASKVVSYQRTPAWILPRPEAKYPKFLKWMFKHIPFVMLFHRMAFYCLLEVVYFLFFAYPHSFITNKMTNLVASLQAKRLTKLNRPDLVDSLRPNYKVGCKRIVFSSQYIDAIARPNSSVIRTPIKEIKSNTIITEDGQVDEFDILVLATGYMTQHGVLGDIEIIGDEGQSLTELWDSKNPQFYNSTITNGFPNMFMLLGPTTILGHHSVVLMIETQVNFAVESIQKLMVKKNIKAIEPTLKAQERYMSDLKDNLKNTVWTTSCHSWYKNNDGEITNIYPNTVSRFKWDLSKFNDDDFVAHPQRN